jgi:hypothetical protein
LYNSDDELPSWFFANEGHSSFLNLEMEYWYVTDISPDSMWAAVHGNVKAVARPRQMYRIMLQDVGSAGVGWNAGWTRMTYQMRHFFIDEAVASEGKYSIYTLVFIVLFLIARHSIIQMLVESLMPHWEDPDKPALVRQLPGWLSKGMLLPCVPCASCCGSRSAADEEALGERKPLLP